jgi:hypothetical protein
MGFIATMPDKNSFNLVPLCLLCILAALTGAVALVGALCYAVAKVVADHSPARVSAGVGPRDA